MKVAITTWGNRISPVFDSSNTLMITEIENAIIKERVFAAFNPRIDPRMLAVLKGYQVDALICGAITKSQSDVIESNGIELLSFVAGNVEKVLDSYMNAPQQLTQFLMPGTISASSSSN